MIEKFRSEEFRLQMQQVQEEIRKAMGELEKVDWEGQEKSPVIDPGLFLAILEQAGMSMIPGWPPLRL